ncbi:MAG: PKD domain-containing protein [Flavobacteriales bacterium]|nr:PKD domain-containing protein [Flavobacteriales bacterium]
MFDIRTAISLINRIPWRFRAWGIALAFWLGAIDASMATHIIGGEIYYECQGNDIYKIYLKVYRDCYNGVPYFDNPALLNIFDANNNLIKTINMPLNQGSVHQLQTEVSNPCVNPPTAVCVEAAEYVITETLPPIPGGYQLAYQRCCRNQTISNLVGPGQTGATYYTAILDTGVVVCNSAPHFNEYPPVFVCKDEVLEFDHSATDPDGDSLVYELCIPYDGASYTDPFGNNPINPPPYKNVTFSSPYSLQDPMGGTPLTIDPVTGFLTGIPGKLGQFVVGICVKEYRDGVLIGINKRDFQFNVMYCEPNVSVSIPENVTQCGDQRVYFNNTSKGAFSYFWDFGDLTSDSDTSEDVSPHYDYPGPGDYQVQLIVNKGETCSDTATATISIFPAVHANFGFNLPCLSYASVFSDSSWIFGNEPIQTWSWTFGDGTTSDQPDPVHTYENDGVYPVLLEVVSKDGCRSLVRKTMYVYPDPDPEFMPSVATGCIPLSVGFLPTDSLDPLASYYWDFGDGEQSTDRFPSHVYTDPGSYDISLKMVTRQGCTDSLKKKALLKIYPVPEAKYTVDTYEQDIMHPEFSFTDQSFNAIEWYWAFGDGDSSEVTNPIHVYNDTGWFDVSLMVEDARGCRDTTWDKVYIEPVVSFYVPNVFTPNDDGKNDVFHVYGEYIKEFHMLIFDRWGNVIFETNNMNQGWEAGEGVPEDVYVYKIDYVDALGVQKYRVGSVTLVR